MEAKKLSIPVFNGAGKKVGDEEVQVAAYKEIKLEETNHQIIRAYLASARSGNASTKTRAEVRGGGQKPWRQKGTGRARAGSIRAPHWTGGGTVFGPKPRDYGFDVPKKMRRKALAQTLVATVENGNAVVLKDLKISNGKTSEAVKLLSSLKVDKKALVIVSEASDLTVRAFRNLRNIKLIQPNEINIYDIYWGGRLIIEDKALAQIKELIA